VSLSKLIRKNAPAIKTVGVSGASLGTGAVISDQMARKRLEKQKKEDDARSRKQVKTFIKAVKKLEEKEKTAMHKERLLKLAKGEEDKKDDKKEEKGGGKYVTPDFLMKFKKKDGEKESDKKDEKSEDEKSDKKDDKETEKKAYAKLAAHAGKIIKGLALAGSGAAAGAYGMKKKKEDERKKELRKIKHMNQIENKTIRKHLAKQFKSYNDKENKALAKHFYSAGKRESGGSK
jgi:hypothetical protein